MWQWNCQLWVKKTKRTIECDKSTIICDIGITQYDDRTVKYEEKKKCTTECDKKFKQMWC